jgi:hypothetical protein
MSETGSGDRTAKPGDSTPERPCEALAVIARLEHYVLSLDSVCTLCVAQRTTAAFERPEDIQVAFEAIERTLAKVQRSGYRLLVDTRLGPSRNDPSFEVIAATHRGKLLLGFARNAALAVTAAGRLQIQRYAKVDGRVVFATDEPRAAFEYLGVPYHAL